MTQSFHYRFTLANPVSLTTDHLPHPPLPVRTQLPQHPLQSAARLHLRHAIRLAVHRHC